MVSPILKNRFTNFDTAEDLDTTNFAISVRLNSLLRSHAHNKSNNIACAHALAFYLSHIFHDLKMMKTIFVEKVRENSLELRPISLNILQVNVGLRCNKECNHCHLKAGPDRREEINLETMSRVVELADKIQPSLVDITGGAPEMNPNIRWLITELSKGEYKTQLRTNLTALLLDKSIIDFLVKFKVKLVASLPCYEAHEVDSVRGDGTFDKSIKVLNILNEVGYSNKLELDLVYNPEKDFLPPNQKMLEEVYRKRLNEDYGIKFTNLITIANMPVGRFRENLEKEKKYKAYMKLLRDTFNPETISDLMCRHQVNVNWDGTIYDCDFNLACGLPMMIEKNNINDAEFDIEILLDRTIAYEEYCFGCAAGQGSSCSGALIG